MNEEDKLEPVTVGDFQRKHLSKEKLLKIASNNFGACIYNIDFEIVYIDVIDKFIIKYNPDLNIKDEIVDYSYLIDHLR